MADQMADFWRTRMNPSDLRWQFWIFYAICAAYLAWSAVVIVCFVMWLRGDL